MAVPTCSIIIPVYGHAALTRQCIDTIIRYPPRDVSIEIIVVDDASTDTTSNVLSRYGDAVRVIRHETNRGFAHSSNNGAMAARGTYLLFLNNDMLPETGWLDTLVDYAVRHPAAAIIGSKLLYPDNTIQHAGIAFDDKKRPFHIYVGFPGDHPAVNRSRRLQAVTGGCALIRRDLFVQSGGFDTVFRNSYEDVDLCLRLGTRGYEIHYCHESVLYHLESASRGGFSEQDTTNAQIFDTRWRSHIRQDDWNYYLEDGLVQFVYTGYKPIHLYVSPLLAVIIDDSRDHAVDRLLDAHARRLFQLMRENVRLTTRLLDLEEELAACRASVADDDSVADRALA